MRAPPHDITAEKLTAEKPETGQRASWAPAAIALCGWLVLVAAWIAVSGVS